MEIADALLALGGDKGNTVPKRVTAPEIAVLRAIHGDDAVFDIRPAGEERVSNRDEIQRLRSVYGSAKDQNNEPIVNKVFPGQNPPLPQTLEDLELPDDAFAATQRANAEPSPVKRRGRPPARKAAQVEDDADEPAELPADPEDDKDVLG